MDLSTRFLQQLGKLFLALLLISGVSACEKKSCSNVVCPSYQTCFQGQCYCPDGYEGNDCSIYSYQKFIGYYNVMESCANGYSNFGNYSCNIMQGNYVNQLFFTGLFNMGVQATAYIYNTNSGAQGTYIEIPTQTQGALSFSGTGYFDNMNNRISINFDYTFNGASYQCTHTFYKQ